MITILHGDDIEASRERYFAFKQKKQVIVFEGDDINYDLFLNSVTGADLFGTSPLVCIENLFSQKKADKSFIELLNQKQAEVDVVIWEKKELYKRDLDLILKAKVIPFKLPRSIFQLLDSLGEKPEITINFLQKTAEHTAVEIILSMMIKRFRTLLFLMESSKSPIEEVEKLADWQRSRLQKQTRLFTKTRLFLAYKNLFKIESETKTGQNVLGLKASLDYFLLHL